MGQMRHELGSRRSKSLPKAMAALAALLLAVACTPTAGGGTGSTTTSTVVSGPPVITSFSASRTSGAAPLTTAFQWVISDPDNSSLTCGLDLDNNGSFEVTVSSCSSSSIRSATFNTAGTKVVRLRVSDGGPTSALTSLSLNVGALSPDAFAINVNFNGTFTSSQQTAFTTAATRWSQVIRTGLPDVSVTVAAGACGTGEPAFTGAVDDVTIDASIATIDGVGGILGQAGPCIVRTAGGLPAYGVMEFDTADVGALEANNMLSTVVLHEMGHVLGFGTVWPSPLITGAGSADPEFTGATARGAWSAIGGSGAQVPVENSGGAGTADSHWRESILGNELMTGYLNGGANPLSAVTVGSLADLGYGVDLGAADTFGTPAPASAAMVAGTRIATRLVLPIGSV